MKCKIFCRRSRFYAGTTTRAGSNQEYQLVDERIAALAPKIFQMKKPQRCHWLHWPLMNCYLKNLVWFQKKMPTAGKNLSDQRSWGRRFDFESTSTLGWSRSLCDCKSEEFWMAEKTGVDYPIDYHQDLSKSFRELGIDQVEYVAVLFDITRYFDQIKHLVRPFDMWERS